MFVLICEWRFSSFLISICNLFTPCFMQGVFLFIR
nr:MAG TPA: hypothetical protein [Caudoviricetes sp.]DAU22723.1 MAG TPA: hypothetical protein [Caudoviricetes sp.]DAV14126.1 MAG TPA: hypothetical protein [Caudoviricetes sp.]